jgi:activating signal cointegrator 1
MKVLSLTQPWATLVTIGAKKIETRSWRTDHRGPLAIHAAKGFPRWAQDLCLTEPFLSALATPMVGCGKTRPNQLDRGAIIGVGHLVGMIPTSNLTPAGGVWWDGPDGRRYAYTLTEQEHAFGDYTDGRYAWLLADMQLLTTPIPARGSLGLWTIDDAVIAAALKGHA